MTMLQKIILPVAIILTLASCTSKTEVKEEDKKFVLSDTMAKMITIDSVKTCFIDDALTLSGEVGFDENNIVKIFPRSSGQVTESKVSLGDRVTAGEVVAQIKSADVAGTYADLNSADADITISKRQLDNAEALYKNGIASEKDLIEAQQNYQKALAAKRKIESTLSVTGGKNTNAGGTYSLTAPISGFIVEKKVNAGSFIRPDMGDYLFTISDLKDVWIWANVFEADIAKVKEGNAVQVTTLAYPNKIFTGRIDKMSEVLDPTNKALRVRVTLNNEGLLLKPQMFAKVIVTSREPMQALCIPSTAVITQYGKNYVIIYNSNSDIQVKEVSVMKVIGDKMYLNPGLPVGQKIITKNQLLLYNALAEQL